MDFLSWCPTVDDLNALNRGDISDSARTRILQHLETCPHCRSQNIKIQNPPQGQVPQPVEPAAHEKLKKKKTNVGYRNPDSPASESRPDEPAVSSTYAIPGNEIKTRPAWGLNFLAPGESADEIGRLAGFRVLKQLGVGGMGMVFQAEDLTLRRAVALKVLKPEEHADAGAWQRALREARTMAAVKHDNLVTVYNVGRDADVIWLAMELLQGESLDSRMRRSPALEVPEIIRIARETACGLSAIHQSGLIHRDIKPSNLWLESPAGRVKILDFGLARDVGASQLTQSGTIVGTPAFMSPEQARADSAIDARSDLFSLGSVLYFLCTGQPPFVAKTLIAQLTALAVDTPPHIREVNPLIPAPLADFVMKLLSKPPAERPDNCDEVLRRLNEIENEIKNPLATPPVIQKPVSAPVPASSIETKPAPVVVNPPVAPAPQQSRSLMPLVVGVVLVLLAAFFVFRPPPEGSSRYARPDDRNDVPEKKNLPPDPRIERERPREGPPPEDRERAGVPPFEIAVPVLKAGEMFLIDLPAQDLDCVWFPKSSGRTSAPDPRAPPDLFRQFKLGGTISEHAIGMHPTPHGPAFMDVKLGKQYRTLKAIVSQNDHPHPSYAPMTFRVIGDGKVIWTSPPISAIDDATKVSVSVSGVEILRLEVDASGANPRGAHALWFEPYLEK